VILGAVIAMSGKSDHPETRDLPVMAETPLQPDSEAISPLDTALVEATTRETNITDVDLSAQQRIDPQATDGSDQRPRLVLILDDIGNNAETGMRAVTLPGAVTYAVLPFTPHGKMLAEQAYKAKKEIMLHAPMSNLAGMALGPGGLTLDMNEDDFLQTLREAIADIPHITGVNNHTGSELTAAQQPMEWVMIELKNQGLFFVDSMTTSASIAEATAIAHRVPSLRRHVFLDNVVTEEAIELEFKRALTIAKQQGYAVAIGHPYPETLAYLERALPDLEAQGINLVSASSLIKFKDGGIDKRTPSDP
jgi:uncharacterized protein